MAKVVIRFKALDAKDPVEYLEDLGERIAGIEFFETDEAAPPVEQSEESASPISQEHDPDATNTAHEAAADALRENRKELLQITEEHRKHRLDQIKNRKWRIPTFLGLKLKSLRVNLWFLAAEFEPKEEKID